MCSLRINQKIGSVLFWLVAFVLMAGAKDSSCPTGFSRLRNWLAHAREEKAISSDLHATILNNFSAGLRSPNPEKWTISSKAKALLEKLPTLNEKSRVEFIAKVKANHPSSKNDLLFQQLILLGLYDENTWLKLVDDLENHAILPTIATNFLKTYSEKMPTDLRNKIMSSLGNRYSILSKDRERYELLAPKRVADTFYKYLLRGDEIIQEEIVAGKNSEQAFAKYVAEVQRFIPVENSISANQTIEMLKVAQRTLQREIRDASVEFGVENPEIYLGGSLANGRASAIKSDFDLSANFPLPKELREKIQAELKKNFPLGESFHVSVAPVKQEFWAKTHPIAFRIRENSIEMLAYPADGLANPNLESASVYKISP